MTDRPATNLDADDYVLNRVRLCRDRRDFDIGPGDRGARDAVAAVPEADDVRQLAPRKRLRWPTKPRSRVELPLWTAPRENREHIRSPDAAERKPGA